MIGQVSQFTQQIGNPHALNKLGFRLGFLGRLTDLLNTVGFEISSNFRGTGTKHIAKWEHSILEAEALVTHLGDRKLTCDFDEFRALCEMYFKAPWSNREHNRMKEKQACLLNRIHRLQSKVFCEYVWTVLILVVLIHFLLPRIFPG